MTLPEFDLFDAIHDFVTRFVVLPSVEAGYAITVWIVHTYCLSAFESTPRLAILSPEPGSGKSRLLEIIEALVPNPKNTFNVSAAVLYRSMVDDVSDRPTILLDEADTIFHAKAGEQAQALRAVVNAGHREGSVAERFNNQTNKNETFPAFSPAAIAGLDDLPDTIMSRSVVVRMKKRASDEPVTAYRRRLFKDEAARLKKRLLDWTESHISQLDGFAEDLPQGIEDRAADVWEPLILIGDAHSAKWSQRIRTAATVMHGDSRSTKESLGIRMLADCRAAFNGQHVMHSADLVSALIAIEDGPYSDWKGKELDARGLANQLGNYGIHSTSVRVGEISKKGYKRESFDDAWKRYLPSLPPEEGSQGSQGSQVAIDAVTDVTDVTLAGEERGDTDLPLEELLMDAGNESEGLGYTPSLEWKDGQVVAPLTCKKCRQPMVKDFYGNGMHATCF